MTFSSPFSLQNWGPAFLTSPPITPTGTGPFTGTSASKTNSITYSKVSPYTPIYSVSPKNGRQRRHDRKDKVVSITILSNDRQGYDILEEDRDRSIDNILRNSKKKNKNDDIMEDIENNNSNSILYSNGIGKNTLKSSLFSMALLVTSFFLPPTTTSTTMTASSYLQQQNQQSITQVLTKSLSIPLAEAKTDAVRVGTCLFKNCQLELAKCILDPKCFANIICLNTCNNRPDEVQCQIKCGDLFDDETVGKFNACALSQKKCVPQKPDEGLFPVPSNDALVSSFSPNEFNGRWYISAGLNPLFDTFDCQVHFFDVQDNKLYAKINWRISEPDGEFIEKNTLQRFIQDEKQPGILMNHDNEYLHYQDDWYIVDYEANEFIAIYYRGQNDAWIGYGGAVVYTKDSKFPEKFRPRIEKAFDKVNVKFSDFAITDNSCKPQEQDVNALRQAYAKKLVVMEEQEFQKALTALRGSAVNEVLEKEEETQKALENINKLVEGYEKKLASKTFETFVRAENEFQKVEENVEKKFLFKPKSSSTR